MDTNYSLLKRRSRLDPESTPNLQLLRRRLGTLPIQAIYIKASCLTKTMTGNRIVNPPQTRTQTRTRPQTWTRTWTRTKTRTRPQAWTRTENWTLTRTGTKIRTWARTITRIGTGSRTRGWYRTRTRSKIQWIPTTLF